MIRRVWIFHRSRDSRFVFRVALVIAAASIVAGFLISAGTYRSGTLPFFPEERGQFSGEMLGSLFETEGMGIEDLAYWVRNPEEILEPMVSPGDPWGIPRGLNPEEEKAQTPVLEMLDSLIAAAGVEPGERDLLRDLRDGLHGEGEPANEAREKLLSAAREDPPRPFAAEFLGDVLSQDHEYAAALEQYRTEVERFGERPYSRSRVIQLLKQEGLRSDLREAFRDPDYFRMLDPGERLEIATWLRDWPALVRSAILHDLEVEDPGLLVLSLLAAAVWFLIVAQFAGYDTERLPLYAAALFLGIASATATLAVVQIQEEIQGFTLSFHDSFARQILYCVAGIGLREETVKLLFFLPLAPVLLKRRDEAEMLVCAGLVGLGFALNENVGYVLSWGEFTAWTRFLTANFLHIALTGVIGLSFCRMCRWPRQYWDNFLMDFLIVVAVHGVYDALIMLPAFADYSPAVLIVFALIAYLFLDQAAHSRGGRAGHRVSPLAVFLWGSALLLGVIFGYACWGMPFGVALREYIYNVASMVPIGFVFINRLRDH